MLSVWLDCFSRFHNLPNPTTMDILGAFILLSIGVICIISFWNSRWVVRFIASNFPNSWIARKAKDPGSATVISLCISFAAIAVLGLLVWILK